jgi:hypothetical protein
MGSGAKYAHLCQTLLLSIANLRVYHIALHSGSDSLKEFVLHTFLKSILQQLVAALGIPWTSPFTLPLRPPTGDTLVLAHVCIAIPQEPYH